MGEWVKYLEKLKELSIQLPVFLASWFAIYLQNKSILEFGVFSPLLSFLAVFSSIGVLLTLSLKVFSYLKFHILVFMKHKRQKCRIRKLSSDLENELKDLDIFELHILNLFKRENEIIVNEGKTKNLVDKGFIEIIGRGKFKRRIILTELGKVIQTRPIEDFHAIFIDSCVRFLKSLNDEEVLLIDKICNAENKRLNTHYRARGIGSMKCTYYSFFKNIEDSIFMTPTYKDNTFAISGYGVEAYAIFVND